MSHSTSAATSSPTPSAPTEPLSILIIGSGIAGPTLATFLLQQSPSSSSSTSSPPPPAPPVPKITLLERRPLHRISHGQNVDVRGAGLTIIRKLGLEGAVRAASTGEKGVKWVDGRDRVWAAFGAGKEPEGGGDAGAGAGAPTADVEILRGRLAELCLGRLRDVSKGWGKGEGVEEVFGERVERLEEREGKVYVRFRGEGRESCFDVVVGADGLQSLTRRMVWGEEGEEERVKRLGAYGGFFSMPKSEGDDEWRRWFHADGRRGVMLRPDRENGRTTVFMYVVNNKDARLREVAAKGREDLQAQKDLLEQYFTGAGWECERVLSQMRTAKDFYYDMIGQVKMDAWSKGRVVLLGDAGYCASPFSGMGTTLALMGAYNLAGALKRHPQDPGVAFAEYEAEMRPIVDRAQKLAPGMPWFFNPETAWGVWALNCFVWLLQCSGLIIQTIKYLGPPAKKVAVKDYGFRNLPEWWLDGQMHIESKKAQ